MYRASDNCQTVSGNCQTHIAHTNRASGTKVEIIGPFIQSYLTSAIYLQYEGGQFCQFQELRWDNVGPICQFIATTGTPVVGMRSWWEYPPLRHGLLLYLGSGLKPCYVELGCPYSTWAWPHIVDILQPTLALQPGYFDCRNLGLWVIWTTKPTMTWWKPITYHGYSF